MGYIEELRSLIGHRPVIMVGAGVLITDERGRLLLGKRSDNHSWGIPGGSMEMGETIEETARRETTEETGLKLGKVRLFGVFSGPEFFYTYPSGDQVYNVSIVFESSDFKGRIEESEEHSAFRFFDRDHLPEPLSPPIRPIISQWLEKRSGHPG